MIDKGKLFDLRGMWEDEVELRNPYSFGEENVDLEAFAELFRDTHELIKEIKNEFIYKSKMPDDNIMFGYLKLLKTMARYTTYDVMDDESDGKAFTATCLIADSLVEYAVSRDYDYEMVIDGKTMFQGADDARGVFTFLGCDYQCLFCDVADDKTYTYDVSKGDFSEILELVTNYIIEI